MLTGYMSFHWCVFFFCLALYVCSMSLIISWCAKSEWNWSKLCRPFITIFVTLSPLSTSPSLHPFSFQILFMTWIGLAVCRGRRCLGRGEGSLIWMMSSTSSAPRTPAWCLMRPATFNTWPMGMIPWRARLGEREREADQIPHLHYPTIPYNTL